MARLVELVLDATKNRVTAKSAAHPFKLITLLVVLILLNSALYAWSQFANVADSMLTALLLSGFILVLLAFLKPRQQRTTLALLLVAIMGAAGMLLGSVVDFGRWSIQIFNDLCSPSVNLTLTQDMVRMLSIAPMTHLGMLFGCVGGWLVCDLASYGNRTKNISNIKHGFHIVGMCGVMVITQACIRADIFNIAVPSPNTVYLSPIVLMWTSMLVFSSFMIAMEYVLNTKSARFYDVCRSGHQK